MKKPHIDSRVVSLAEEREERNFREFIRRCDEAAERFPFYVLDADRHVVRGSMDEWVEMKRDFENRCRVALTRVGKVEVSTVFLGLDMNHARIIRPELPTVCFETLVGGAEVADRYTTWDEAKAGHEAIVTKLRSEG